jgi:hypothetical protein
MLAQNIAAAINKAVLLSFFIVRSPWFFACEFSLGIESVGGNEKRYAVFREVGIRP